MRAALLVLAVTLVALPVAAQPASGSDPVAASLQKFEEGRKAFDEKRYLDALGAFQASYALQPSPNSRLYMARCYVEVGRVASAYVSYRLAAREAQDRLAATGEKRFALTRDAATSEGAEIESRVPRLTLAVPGGVPDDFVVKQNGSPVARAAWGGAVETDPGHVVIEATGHRIAPFRVELDIKEGDQRRVEVVAQRVPTAYLVLRFRARPAGLSVAIDGAPVDARSVDARQEVDVGDHSVVVQAPRYLPFRWTKRLVDGQTKAVTVDLRPDAKLAPAKGTAPWLFYSAGGASLVTLGVGAGIAYRANQLSVAEQGKNPFARDPVVRDTIRSEQTAANVLFVAGAVFAAGAGVLAFTTTWNRPRDSVALVPWATPSGGGVGARGSF